MPITDIQKQQVAAFIPMFTEYLQTSNREDDIEERKKRSETLSLLLSRESLADFDELKFGQVISSLWASLMWGNPGYLVDQLIRDNGFDNIKNSFVHLIWDNNSIINRYNQFRHDIKRIGAGMITEILAFLFPEKYGLYNSKARKALIYLGFHTDYPFLRKDQISGEQYQQYNTLLLSLKEELITQGVQELDLLGIDYFLFEVWKAINDTPETPDRVAAPQIQEELTDFDHEEMIDKIIQVGTWLGFEVHRSVHVATGAVVDAVWQAKIANLGVVTYVFEVQRHGGIDSLILNLQRAQNNPTVQRLVVAALPNVLENIKSEIEPLPEVFRKAVAYMDVNEVIRAADLAGELSQIIDKLKLARGEFGV